MPIDLSLLDPASPRFFQVLRSSVQKLTRDQIPDYFSTLADLLASEDMDVRSAVAEALCDFFSQNPPSVQTFQTNRCLRQIPISEEFLAVCQFLAATSPNCLNAVCRQLLNAAAEFPGHVLSIIAVYSRQFDELHDPWPVIDLLFSQSSVFGALGTAENFLRLLSYLVQFDAFAAQKAQAAWDCVVEVLELKSVAVVCSGYSALIHIAGSGEGEIENFPIDLVTKHLRLASRPNGKFQAILPCAISLLLHVPAPEPTPALIQALLLVAETNVRGTVVLISLIQQQAAAATLVTDTTWLSKELPTLVDTIRILGAVLIHAELRQSITAADELPGFLNRVTKLPEGLTIIAILVRRLVLDAAALRRFSRARFLQSYFRLALTHENPGVAQAGLLVVKTIAGVGYTAELDLAAADIVNMIRTGTALTKAALSVGPTLCEHPTCLAVFRKLKLAAALRRVRNVPQCQDLAELLLDAVEPQDAFD
jgi:hypothetical protein